MLLSVACFLALFLLFPAGTLFAQETETGAFSLRLNQAAVQQGYTLAHPSGEILLAVRQDVLDRPATVILKPQPAAETPEPQGFLRVSPVYSFDVLTDPPKVTAFPEPLVLVLRHASTTFGVKHVRLWDSINRRWQPLPSESNAQAKTVRAFVTLSYARVAVFESAAQEGIASWYRSTRYPYGAASNDFPEGTKLRVTNVENGKAVVVTVVSNGPFVPNRVIDLSLTAFKDIAAQNAGVARVRVEPADGRSITQRAMAGNPPATKGKTAFVWRTDSDTTLFEKDYRARPIASITKLMAALVFLDTKPNGAQVVTYEARDDAEGSKLTVRPGETMTVGDLFQTMLVGSANNATKTLVRVSGLSPGAFVERMNAKALALEMRFTRFTEPTGLDPGNVATPGDIAKLVHTAVSEPVIQKALTRSEYVFTTKNTGRQHTIKNTNKLLGTLPIVGGKTGYIDEAGYGLAVEIAGTNGANAVVMTLHAPSLRARDEDVLALGRWALAAL